MLTRGAWASAVIGIATAGCGAVQVVAEADPVLDAAAADWCGQIEAFLTRMEGQAGMTAGGYEANARFYQELKGAIAAQRLRAEVAGHTSLVLQTLDLLAVNVDDLAKLHQSPGGLTSAVAEPARQALEVQFRALFKLEAELRGGAHK